MSFSSFSSALAALSSFSLSLGLSEGTDCKAELAAIAADPANTSEERTAARAILAGWNDEDFMAA